MQTILVGRKTGSWADAPEQCGGADVFNNEWRSGEMPSDAQKPFPVIGIRNRESHPLLDAIINSPFYQEYAKAFSDATGLPVALRAADSWPLAGISDTAVPVRLGGRLIGYLQPGGTETNENELTSFGTTGVSNKQQDAVHKLLTIFAQHLSMLGNQVVVQRENSEPSVITRAREYIHQHHAEDISLGQVAKAVNTSTFYFCKIFKKFTGINFTDYLSHVRIEKSKNLLLNPNLRVSEIAFEVGFQSLTHFNRVFKKLEGQSPTQYRAQLLGNRRTALAA